jgi:calcineurin-like phosphoesterase family protein
MIWFSSDWHIGHANIIGMCGRPFASVEEMDQAIIDNVNNWIRPHDTLYFLGDLCWWKGERWGVYQRWVKTIRQIKCNNRILIKGNHDLFTDLFKSAHDRLELKTERGSFVLDHYALRTWHHKEGGVYHLYGHSHDQIPEHDLSFDIGVDSVSKIEARRENRAVEPKDFRPWSLEEVANYLVDKKAAMVVEQAKRMEVASV